MNTHLKMDIYEILSCRMRYPLVMIDTGAIQNPKAFMHTASYVLRNRHPYRNIIIVYIRAHASNES
jgi:hypothetical protein